ncbi:MAG: 2-phosphosulfolactate phosphatase [Pseudomonadota bacterium]
MTNGDLQNPEPTKRPVYRSIPRTLASFGVIGMSTTATVERKLDLLRDQPASRTGIVIFDAYRCSSTILACFAGGVTGAFVKEKVVASGVDVPTAQRIAQQLGKKLVLGGELDGKPVPGGVVGNSPLDAFRADINDSILHFQSTNFGRIFARLTEFAAAQQPECDVFVFGFPNAGTTARAIQSGAYDRVIVAAAGFFECLAIEDLVLGGEFLSLLGRSLDELDDDALAMLAAYKAYSADQQVLQRCWTARVLEELEKTDDILDVLDGRRLPLGAVAHMSELILRVHRHEALPMIRSHRAPGKMI